MAITLRHQPNTQITGDFPRLQAASPTETALAAFSPDVVSNLRRLTTHLAYQEHLPERIALVAALRGEGVTYTTLALATTLANDLNARVCAVELNWQSPGMQAHLANPAETKPRRGRFFRRRKTDPATTDTTGKSPGLAGVLTGSATLEEALIPTLLPNLALLPAGELPEWQRPAIARSVELKECIGHLSRMFDHVLLDIPAVLRSSDAIALASLGSACCIVIQQGVTPINSIRLALDDVKHLPMLGVVCNQVRIHTPKWVRSLLPQD
jgi:Mrp family chromosome partitioning ATPase